MRFEDTITRDATRRLFIFFHLNEMKARLQVIVKWRVTVAADLADFEKAFVLGDVTCLGFTFHFGNLVSESGCLLLRQVVHLWLYFWQSGTPGNSIRATQRQ